MLRISMVLLVLGSTVLAGPAIHVQRRLNRSEENAMESSSVMQETNSSAVTEAAALNEVSETSTAAQPITAVHTTSVVAEQTTTAAPLSTHKPRKTITFDQRQEGKFNIRADLENFVIVVVPSSPSAGISLLDLLNRSGQKHQQKKKSSHRKHTKNHGAQKKISNATPEVVVLDESQSHARVVANEEFIEGRTPYKVDISSTARSSNSDQPSPIYRVVRPFNFHVEQPTSSNMVHFPEPSGNYYPNTVRKSKSLLGPAPYHDEIRTNTVYTILTNNNYGDGAIQDIEDDGTGDDEEVDDDDDDDNYLMMEQRTYLDLPTSSFDSLEYPRSDVDMMKLQLQGDNEQDGGGDVGGEWELKLLGAQEQCGPDRKRDSYGVCQFVTP